MSSIVTAGCGQWPGRAGPGRTSTYARELDNIQGYTDAAGNRVPGLAELHGYTYNPATATYEPPLPRVFNTAPTVVVQPFGPYDKPN
ncbi:MAG: hypothetical protein M3Y54_13240 [Bacteroidota bacterium]|nr:hypothetical protein [Bacteroidota bacterium]